MKSKIFFLLLASGLLFAQTKQEEFKSKYLDKNITNEKYNTLKPSRDFNISEKEINSKTNMDNNVYKKEAKQLSGYAKRKANAQRESAQEISKTVKSSAFSKKLENMENYILRDKTLNFKEKILKSSGFDVEKMVQTYKKDKNKILSENEKLFMVISSSMSKQLIKNYFKQLTPIKHDITFVLQGGIGGIKKIMPTLNWIASLLEIKDKKTAYQFNIYIDPQTVLQTGIKKVPALLYIRDITKLDQLKKDDFFVVFGAVDSKYALRKIVKKYQTKELKKLYKTL